METIERDESWTIEGGDVLMVEPNGLLTIKKDAMVFNDRARWYLFSAP